MGGPRWRKVFRDLWTNKTRTILVVLSIAVGVFAVGLIACTQIILLRDMNTSYAATNPAHATLYVDSFEEELVDSVRRMPGVADASGHNSVDAQVRVGDDWSDFVLIVVPDFNDLRINIIKPVSGVWPPRKRQILLERTSLGYLGVEEGDTITIETSDGKLHDLSIAGSVHDQSIGHASIDGKGYGYITGDRARYLPDGALELLGRSDHQVKIRGHRIELGELEALLAQHPAVHTALVNLTSGPDGAKLVAYIVPHVDAPTPTPEPEHEAAGSLLSDVLRAFLRARVPEYMIPSAFVQLDALPLTPNGKLDRRALPDPVHTVIDAVFVAPETPVERDLAAIWSRVLKREPISIHDNFFALGGHSLLAGQILHQINSAFEFELPLRRLFEEPTIAELALSIEELWIAELESLSEADAREQLM